MIKFNDLFIVERSNSNGYRTPIFKYLGRVDNTVSGVMVDPIKDKTLGDTKLFDLHKIRFINQVDTKFSKDDEKIISQIAVDLETGNHLLNRRSKEYVNMFNTLIKVLNKVSENKYITWDEQKLYIEYLSNIIYPD